MIICDKDVVAQDVTNTKSKEYKVSIAVLARFFLCTDRCQRSRAHIAISLAWVRKVCGDQLLWYYQSRIFWNGFVSDLFLGGRQQSSRQKRRCWLRPVWGPSNKWKQNTTDASATHCGLVYRLFSAEEPCVVEEDDDDKTILGEEIMVYQWEYYAIWTSCCTYGINT